MVRARKLFVLAGAVALFAGQALAQTSPTAHGPFDTNQPQTSPQGTPSAPYFYKPQGYGLSTLVTPGTPFAASSVIDYVCTTSGTITVTLASGATMTFPILASASLQTLTLSVTNIALGTAVATFWSMQ
jgi:hypothetical protein